MCEKLAFAITVTLMYKFSKYRLLDTWVIRFQRISYKKRGCKSSKTHLNYFFSDFPVDVNHPSAEPLKNSLTIFLLKMHCTKTTAENGFEIFCSVLLFMSIFSLMADHASFHIKMMRDRKESFTT